MRRGRVIASTLFVALVGFTMLGWLVDSVIFQPSPGIDLRPSQLGIEAEEVWLDSEGVRIHGFYLPAATATATAAGRGARSRENARAILFFHGNAGNASHRLPNAAELARLGADVLLIDYRGYGMSEGRPSEAGAYADARAGLAYLTEERGFAEQRIVLFGRSLGGAIAVDLARDRALGGVILESTFSSASDVAKSAMGPLLAVLARGRFDSASKVDRVRAPLLFFHGDRDTIVAYELGRRLFELAPEPKHFETIAGAGHNDTVEVGGRAYFDRIARFLDEVAP